MKNPNDMKKNASTPRIVGALTIGALLYSVLACGEKVAESNAKAFDLDTLSRTPPASGTILDFETNDERDLVPDIDNASCRVFVTNRLATSGEHAVAFICADWRPGMEVWPSFTIDLPIDRTDWRGYDRLAIDVVNFGKGHATGLGMILGGPEGRIQNGFKVGTKLPENGYVQWIVPLDKMSKSVAVECVSRVHFFTSNPVGFAVAIDRLTLLRPGEEPPLPDGPNVGRDLWPRLAARQREMQARLDEGDGYALDVLRFRRACRQEGVKSSAMLLGKATSMEKILPRGRFAAKPLTKEGLTVRLARNEYESVQELVMPKGDDLRGVKVAVDGDLTPMQNAECTIHNDGEPSALQETDEQTNRQTDKTSGCFAASNIQCAAMGYVRIAEPPSYWVGYNEPSGVPPGYVRKIRPAELGWWPDPILGFLEKVDVGDTDLQSFWVRVHCPERQAAGLYAGTLIISAEGVEPVRVPFAVRVNDFSLGSVSELPLAINFNPGPMGAEAKKRVAAAPAAPSKMWKRHKDEWVDFLADYLIPFDGIYDWGDPSRLFAQKRLLAQGRSGLMNLRYWGPCGSSEESKDKFRATIVGGIMASYRNALAAGQRDFYIYGCDECTADKFPQIRTAALEIKKALPDVPLLTTAYDHDFGVGTPLDVIDWFCPLTPSYDVGKAMVSRKAGHQVWWYVCSQPPPPYANAFIESAAIETRLLMGAQSVRMRPDGFLYYQISLWNSTNCIKSGPFTDWDVRTYLNYHGDGQWTAVGPDGIPLPTIRLENFRDGLEDYAYAKLLEVKLREVEAGGATTPSSSRSGGAPSPLQDWLCRARAALAVPRELMDTMTNYSDDPAALYRWRDELADLIESAGNHTKPGNGKESTK